MTIPRLAATTRLAPVPRALLDALQAAGLDPAAIARGAGVDAAALDTGLAFPAADRFFCAVWEAVRDPTMGLRAGSVLRPERFGVVGVAAMASPTFGTAVRRKARYWRLIWGDAYEVEEHGDECSAVLTPAGPERPYTQAKIDMELASLLAFGRLFTGRPVTPRRLALCQPAPPWRRAYEETFGCPVQFGSASNSLTFASADFDLPLVSRNAQLDALVTPGVEDALARFAPASLREQAALEIDGMLQGDEPTLQALAARLHRSARTLQRQLAAEGVRFGDLLDERRQRAARRHLAGSTATAEEVAFLLGFATPSSFHRAFKRWTGQTPDGWRRSQPLCPSFTQHA